MTLTFLLFDYFVFKIFSALCMSSSELILEYRSQINKGFDRFYHHRWHIESDQEALSLFAHGEWG